MVAYCYRDGIKLPLKKYMLYGTDPIMVSIDDGKTFGMLKNDYKSRNIKQYFGIGVEE
jgi:phage anti-repressor protein